MANYGTKRDRPSMDGELQRPAWRGRAPGLSPIGIEDVEHYPIAIAGRAASRTHAAASAIARSSEPPAPLPSPFSKSPSIQPSWLDTWETQITGRAQAAA